MMRIARWIAVSILIALSLALRTQAAQSHDLVALPRWPAGTTTVNLHLSLADPYALIDRRITSRVDLIAAAGIGEAAWDLAVKTLVIADQPVVSVAVQAGLRGIDLLAALDLGPVLIEAGRHWIGDSLRWVRLAVSPRPFLTMRIEAEVETGRIVPGLGLDVYPVGTRRWGIRVDLRPRRMELSVRGAFK